MSTSDSGVSDIDTPSDSSVNDESSGVGLSNPQLSSDRRKLLDSINRLRNTGVQADIDLPGIVVIGGQSAGKSSLIESISGITLPRAAGTCTRCPTECRLSCSAGPWTCTVELHYLKDQTGSALGQARTIIFGDPIFDKSQVEDRIRRAQRAILSPNKPPHSFLTDDGNSPTELSFSTNYISLQISGPKVADLSFVDLPGLIASVSTKSGNEADIAMVENLVTSYISKPNCIILLTVACETDFENQGSHHLTKRHDPQGKRTIGVLTKPDRIPTGDEDNWLALIRNERDALENNWYCVKQPSSQDLKEGITWSSARAREQEFFSSKSPWAELDPVYQPYLGTPNLVQRLSSILSDLISKRLPQIQVELELAIQQTRASLELLPQPPSDDAVLEITTLVHSFTRELDQMIEGVPHADGLIQTLRPAQEEFRRNIRRTAPDFRPFESGQSAQANRLMPPDPDFLREEEGREHWPSQSLSPARVPIFVNEVLTRAENARSRELPGHYPFAVQKAYIADFTRRWADPARALCTSVHKTLSAQVTTLITNHFSAFGQGTLEDRVQVVVQAYIQELVSATKAAVLKEIQHEENGPHTLNTHYLSDYKEKFMTYYKQLRQKDRNPTLAAAIPSLNPVIDEVPPSPDPISRSPSVLVSEVLRNLSALNLSIRAEDLMKLCPRDPMEPAFNIMADVRAYFQVAYKRVADTIPATIDDELVRGVGKNILPTLMKGLGLNGPEAIRIAKDFARENPATAKKRVELEKKLERLRSASQQLFAL
ncbi:P-loop containing nucleoside triphosphate hydrolase protein [Favolaschia claudopus]|uniref:P-loop containing nucleoside triphosphate hydrolase protein n=1 Tax=Favolaschia claudopus TaxID=2862362 RepID=A0AAW0CDQ6_9AGAR